MVDGVDVVDQLGRTERRPRSCRSVDCDRRQLVGDGPSVQARLERCIGERAVAVAAVVESAPLQLGSQYGSAGDDLTERHRRIDSVPT